MVSFNFHLDIFKNKLYGKPKNVTIQDKYPLKITLYPIFFVAESHWECANGPIFYNKSKWSNLSCEWVNC